MMMPFYRMAPFNALDAAAYVQVVNGLLGVIVVSPIKTSKSASQFAYTLSTRCPNKMASALYA